MDKNKDANRQGNSEERNADLPGYPHYPPEEDIMNPQHGFKKIHADEELANSRSLSGKLLHDKEMRMEESIPDVDDNIVKGGSTLSKDDMISLGERGRDQDMNDDELVSGSARVDELPDEVGLDVPGAELDDDQESLGEEDEENNYYSLGGDRHESLEEEPSGDDLQ